MAINGVTAGPDGSSTVRHNQTTYIGPTKNIKPDTPKVTEQTLRDAHITLTEMTQHGLTDRERQLFRECKEILLLVANDQIPTDRDVMKRKLQTLKKVRGLLKKGKPIPQDIIVLYQRRHGDIQRNIKTYVAKKSESYARKLSFSSDPKKGLREICDKASSALFWNVYAV